VKYESYDSKRDGGQTRSDALNRSSVCLSVCVADGVLKVARDWIADTTWLSVVLSTGHSVAFLVAGRPADDDKANAFFLPSTSSSSSVATTAAAAGVGISPSRRFSPQTFSSPLLLNVNLLIFKAICN